MSIKKKNSKVPPNRAYLRHSVDIGSVDDEAIGSALGGIQGEDLGIGTRGRAASKMTETHVRQFRRINHGARGEEDVREPFCLILNLEVAV